jgi:hypothetical protein
MEGMVAGFGLQRDVYRSFVISAEDEMWSPMSCAGLGAPKKTRDTLTIIW